MSSRSSKRLKTSSDLLNPPSRNAVEDGDKLPVIPSCTVYLCKRSIKNNKASGSSSFSGQCCQNIPIAKHWVLYFDWGYYQAHYEATRVDGKLEFSKGKGEPKTPGFTFNNEKLKTLQVWPDTVDEEAKKNKFNGVDYNVAFANCQDWARELGKRLGIKLPQGQAACTILHASLKIIEVEVKELSRKRRRSPEVFRKCESPEERST
ncbi:uncharacterized protein [Palaemon carinicauda]|uniref:uncharacterized protein n=1 Tax=Palaemon carinicauda TaxID=392227 RepID=UPI0035B590FC